MGALRQLQGALMPQSSCLCDIYGNRNREPAQSKTATACRIKGDNRNATPDFFEAEILEKRRGKEKCEPTEDFEVTEENATIKTKLQSNLMFEGKCKTKSNLPIHNVHCKDVILFV